MGLFHRKVASHFIPIHRDNVASEDWIVILEIIGPSRSKLRVVRATQERQIVKKYNIFLRPTHYLVVEGFNPRIHALYFCPQLYRHEADGALLPLQGEEIGALLAQSVESGVTDQRSWYEATEPIRKRRS